MMYRQLAAIYDRFMDQEVYLQWVEFVEQVWAKWGEGAAADLRAESGTSTNPGTGTEGMKSGTGIPPLRILDLGCGTGTVSVLLAERGHNVVGVDLSEEMLAVAQEKAARLNLSIQWIHQSMAELELPFSVDYAVCLCDSLNYITDSADIIDTFHRVYRHLRPEGLFLFDVHTLFKFEQSFSDRTYTWNEKDLAYIWESEFDNTNGIATHELTFFVSESLWEEVSYGGRRGESMYGGHMSTESVFRRIEETHVQSAYRLDLLEQWLVEAGFEICSITGDFTFEPVREDDERAFVVCRKS